jgi:hypothetical protein
MYIKYIFLSLVGLLSTTITTDVNESKLSSEKSKDSQDLENIHNEESPCLHEEIVSLICPLCEEERSIVKNHYEILISVIESIAQVIAIKEAPEEKIVHFIHNFLGNKSISFDLETLRKIVRTTREIRSYINTKEASDIPYCVCLLINPFNHKITRCDDLPQLEFILDLLKENRVLIESITPTK